MVHSFSGLTYELVFVVVLFEATSEELLELAPDKVFKIWKKWEYCIKEYL